jgi:hypothetical protein
MAALLARCNARLRWISTSTRPPAPPTPRSLAVTPLRALAIDSAAADVASLAAAAPTVGVDGLVRVIKRALPAGLARAECPASVEPLAWAAIDTRAQRLVLPAP